MQEAVRPGIEVLLGDSAHLVRDRRVGLVTNQSGIDASGVSDVVRLQAAGVRLVALFSPEHGFRGAADPGAAVASSVDSATGLPIYSLYGRTSAPTDEMLAGIDVLLVDLQDAGARYYTYITTTVDVRTRSTRRTRYGFLGVGSCASARALPRAGAGRRLRVNQNGKNAATRYMPAAARGSARESSSSNSKLAIPEPSVAALLGGCAALLGMRRRRLAPRV